MRHFRITLGFNIFIFAMVVLAGSVGAQSSPTPVPSPTPHVSVIEQSIACRAVTTALGLSDINLVDPVELRRHAMRCAADIVAYMEGVSAAGMRMHPVDVADSVTMLQQISNLEKMGVIVLSPSDTELLQQFIARAEELAQELSPLNSDTTLVPTPHSSPTPDTNTLGA